MDQEYNFVVGPYTDVRVISFSFIWHVWQLFMTGNAALVGSMKALGIGATVSEVKKLRGRKRRISVTARALI